MESSFQNYKPGREITLLELIEECELEQKIKRDEEESRNCEREGDKNSEDADPDL